MYQVLVTLSKILAPFIPFLSEEIYKNLTSEESVHLQDWPRLRLAGGRTSARQSQSLIKDMEVVRKICELGHAARKTAEIKVRQPLASLTVTGYGLRVDDNLIRLIKDELNIKKVTFETGKGDLKVQLDTIITPELKAEGEARELVRKIQALRKKDGYRLNQKIIVYGPEFPKEERLRDYLKKKTLATKLLLGKDFKIAALDESLNE